MKTLLFGGGIIGSKPGGRERVCVEVVAEVVEVWVEELEEGLASLQLSQCLVFGV